jgi:hypothetical protein
MSVRLRRSSLQSFRYLAILCAALLASCGPATPPPPGAETQQPQEQIKQRAEARWNKMIARDFGATYAYATPAYRATVSLDQHLSRFGSAMRWYGVTVDQVTVAPAGDRADVQVTLQYEVQAPVAGHSAYGIQSLTEHWILSQGDWWLVEDTETP